MTLAGLLDIALSAVAVYAAVLVLTRLGGLRSFAKLTSFDFALTVAIGSMVATAVTSEGSRLGTSVVGLAAIYAVHIGFAALRGRWQALERLADNRPILLMDERGLRHENLHHAHVTEDDVRSQIRLAGVSDLSEVHAVVMETTGEVAVLRKREDGRSISDWLLDDVRGT